MWSEGSTILESGSGDQSKTQELVKYRYDSKRRDLIHVSHCKDVFSRNNGFGSVIGSIGTTSIYFSMSEPGKSNQPTVRKVKDILMRQISGLKVQIRLRDIIKALKMVLKIIFEQLEDLFEGFEDFDFGIGNGIGSSHDWKQLAKHKRSGPRSSHQLNTVRWDISDSATHYKRNWFEDRDILSDRLRTHMTGKGLTNLTFAHMDHDETASAILAYRDGTSFSCHWRPSVISGLNIRDKVLKKHYPFFDAGGAGFKISGSIHSKTAALSGQSAEAAAQLIAVDYLGKRQSASFVGYQDQSKGRVGHRLCLLAEDKKFGLNHELHRCFGDSRQDS